MPCNCYYFNNREDANQIANVFGVNGLNYPRLAYVPELTDNNWQCRIYQANGCVREEYVDRDHSLVCFVHDTPNLPRWRTWARKHGNVFVVFVSEGANIQRAKSDPENIDIWGNELNATSVQEYITRLCAGGEL